MAASRGTGPPSGPTVRRLPRAGIVHRLDKDTSGLMLVGRSLVAVTALVRMIGERGITHAFLVPVALQFMLMVPGAEEAAEGRERTGVFTGAMFGLFAAGDQVVEDDGHAHLAEDGAEGLRGAAICA